MPSLSPPPSPSLPRKGGGRSLRHWRHFTETMCTRRSLSLTSSTHCMHFYHTAPHRRSTASRKPVGRRPETRMQAEPKSTFLILGLAAIIVVLAILSLMVGPSGLSPRAALAGLWDGEGTAGIIVRNIRLPRTLLALLIGLTFG